MTAKSDPHRQPKETAIWSFKTEICNGEKFYPLFRGDQQWGYANEKTFAELMVRALNRDASRTTAPAAQERIDAVIKELEQKICDYQREAKEKDNYCLSYRAAGIAEAIALLQAGRT